MTSGCRCGLGIFIAALILLATITPAGSRSTSPDLQSFAPAAFSTVDWANWASSAWGYYQLGWGVHETTGLHRATLAWHCFTDWDLGSYIYAIIYARKLNLITDSGDWQFDYRIGKILTFLQNRPLGTGDTPYLGYDWAYTYATCSDFGSTLTNAADAGRLLAALHALRTFRPGYASMVDAVFNRSESAYDTFAGQLGGDYYSYLAAEGFAAFGYSTTPTFNAIDNYSGSFVPVYGQNLPSIKTLSEPIIHALLESEFYVHALSTNFHDFASRVYFAQSARQSSTGKMTAFTEGVHYPSPTYIYEWIIYPEKTSEQWVIGNAGLTTIYDIAPIAYSKVAVAFLAVYGETSYTTTLMNVVKDLATGVGFGEAVHENGESAVDLWGGYTTGFYTDKTNELVLAAAAFHAASPTKGFFHPFTEFWFSRYDMLNAEWDAIHVVNVGTENATIQITIGTTITDSLELQAGQATYVTYPGVADGPVHVTANQLIWVTQRIVGWTAMQEIYGMPGDVADTNIIWTWYDSTLGTSDVVFVINPSSTQTAGVDIYVAGTLRGHLDVPPGEVLTTSFPDLIGGPVLAVSGIPVFASQRVIGFSDFAEIIGLPTWYTFTETWFNWYDMASASWDGIHMLNPGAIAATVNIYIAGTLRATLSLAPGVADYRYFPGLMGGPVRVTSSQPVWVTQRIVGWGGWKEVFGVPTSLATKEWYFTWYDMQSAQWDGIHVINPGASSATVQVFVGGVLKSTISVGAGQAAYVYYSGLASGPVRVVSNVPIISSQRILGWQSFEETIGASLTP